MTKMTSGDAPIPDNWNEYVVLQSTVNTPLWQSGVVKTTDSIAVSKGGLTVNLPYLGSIPDGAQVLANASSLTVDKLTGDKTIIPVFARGKALSVNELAPAYQGNDPVGAIINGVGAFWAREYQSTVIAQLNGAFAATSMANSVLDISALANAASVFSTESFIDAEYLLGDHADELAAIACHSLVVAKMEKLDLLDHVVNASTGQKIVTYRGKQVIKTDQLSANAGVYTMFLLGQGAFGFAEGADLAALETDRDILAGDNLIAFRKHFALGLGGVSYTGTVQEGGPTNTALATGTNWTRKYDNKLIKAAAFKFKLA